MAEKKYRVEDPQGERMRLPEPSAPGKPNLHIPDSPHRPGEEPRYARFTQQPLDLARPEPLAHYSELREHANGLVRVLDDQGNATGAWNPQLKPQTMRRGLEMMLRTRIFDARMFGMQRQGRLSFYLESVGEEAVSVASALVFEPEDLLFPSYRQQGLIMARGMTPLDMMCQCIGNQRDNAKGRQMPVHYSWKKGNIVSISSPVGTQFPQAVGAAMGIAYRGQQCVAATWLGDGTASQGDFHYGLNFASVYMPPVLLHVVNNQWAISTHRNLATGGTSFAARAESYGIPGIRVDGNDFLAVYAATVWARERAMRGGGPTLIELLTYRVGAHSTSDDPSCYRPTDEGRLWPGGDPIERLANHLKNIDAWDDAKQKKLHAELEQEMQDTYKQAESFGTLAHGPFDAPGTMFEDVYEQIPENLERQRNELLGEEDSSN